MEGIELLRRDGIEQVTTTLSKAFAADPMFEWIFPDPVRRASGLHHLNSVSLEYGLRYGRATHSHGGAAVAVWIPPGREISMGGMVRCGLLSVPFRVGFAAYGKFMAANNTMERIHRRRVREPHWYLLIVGVDPDVQGRGLGSALVREGLARADEEGRPVYLETSEKRNLGFYERHGFVVLDSATLGRGGPTAWAMRRDPGAATRA
jgi:ribosomal protein S18 acetylase RimI-like enzyme